MGFLKFLNKKEEKKPEMGFSHDELELPPPPQFGVQSPGLPAFSGPQLGAPPARKLDIPDLNANKAGMGSGELEKLPEISAFDFSESSTKKQFSIPQELAGSALNIRIPELNSEEELFKEEQVTLPVKLPEIRKVQAVAALPAPSFLPEQPVFVKAYKFREILEDIDSILKSQKVLESELARIKREKDGEYEKFSRCMEDALRKLMVVDKNMFEV